jgi:hypothetical protein
MSFKANLDAKGERVSVESSLIFRPRPVVGEAKSVAFLRPS